MRRGGESTLAVHPGALGDVILFGHLLRHIGGRVTLVARGEKAQLLRRLGVVDAVMDFDALPIHEVFSGARPEQCQLAALLGRREQLISCFGAGNPAAEAALATVCGARSATFLPVRPPGGVAGHLLEYWAQQMDLPPLPAKPAPWPVPAELRRKAAAVLAAAGVPAEGRYVVMHPGAGAPAKCWPLERFGELARLLKRNAGLDVVWALGPAERERWGSEARELLAAAGAVLPPVDLATLAGVLVGAVGFVGNDSGPAHLAAAVGAATVVVASQASAGQFAPRGAGVRIVAGPAVAEVPLAAVAGAVLEALSELRRARGEPRGAPPFKN